MYFLLQPLKTLAPIYCIVQSDAWQTDLDMTRPSIGLFVVFLVVFVVVTKASFRQSHEDSGGEMEAALLPYHEPDSRMEGFTKINTYIYHGINTGPVGTFVGVSLAAVKTTAILHLKQYYSLGCWWSCVCGSYFLRWCLNNWEWKMSILFTLILSHSSSSGLFTIC